MCVRWAVRWLLFHLFSYYTRRFIELLHQMERTDGWGVQLTLVLCSLSPHQFFRTTHFRFLLFTIKSRFVLTLWWWTENTKIKLSKEVCKAISKYAHALNLSEHLQNIFFSLHPTLNINLSRIISPSSTPPRPDVVVRFFFFTESRRQRWCFFFTTEGEFFSERKRDEWVA